MAKIQKKGKAQTRRKAHPPVTGRERPGSVPAPSTQGRGKLERVRLPAAAAKPSRAETPPAADEANEGKYVYCIIKSERPLTFGPLGLGVDPADVHTVHYRDIAAVV